jgi:hypothetical protein
MLTGHVDLRGADPGQPPVQAHNAAADVALKNRIKDDV